MKVDNTVVVEMCNKYAGLNYVNAYTDGNLEKYKYINIPCYNSNFHGKL